MRTKKIAVVIVLLLFIIAVVYFAMEYFFTSKQVYEGILVYEEQIRQQIAECI